MRLWIREFLNQHTTSVSLILLNSNTTSFSLFAPIWNSLTSQTATTITVGSDLHFELAPYSTSEARWPYYISVSQNGFLGQENLKPWRPPSFSIGERREIQRVKPSLTFLEWPWSHMREVVHVQYVCVCLCKWLLCSSDNAMVPDEARGYEGERIMWLVDVLHHLKWQREPIYSSFLLMLP